VRFVFTLFKTGRGFCVRELLKQLEVDYLLVNSTNEYLVEYSSLNENARYSLTGFSGSTGDALITEDNIYLFVDGRYHIQADNEVKKGITVVKLGFGQIQDDEIRKLIEPSKTLGIVAKKVSQARLESFNGYNIKLLKEDPINNFTELHTSDYVVALEPKIFKSEKPILITNLEEVSYLTGYRDYTVDFSSKIWAKMIVKEDDFILFTDNKACEDYLTQFDEELIVDKNLINAYDYSLIKYPIHKASVVKKLKSVKTDEEIEAYKKAFNKTDMAVNAIREYIETKKDISEYDIAKQLKKEFVKYGAKSLSFKSIVAINENSALAHYSKNSKNKILHEGDLVLIDCGAYYDSGLATDITRVFVKGKPSKLQKQVYTLVLKAFLNAYNSRAMTGFGLNSKAHKILDNQVFGFGFSHGLGHGIGINVHEAPPSLSYAKIAREKFEDNMCFTIEPGLYNPKYFGVRLENSCYRCKGRNKSFTKMGFEGKLIDYKYLDSKEQKWLEEFEIL